MLPDTLYPSNIGTGNWHYMRYGYESHGSEGSSKRKDDGVGSIRGNI